MTAVQPVLLGAETLVGGDLCDVSIRGRYCLHDAATAAVDVDGATRILCAEHAAMYFPNIEL